MGGVGSRGHATNTAWSSSPLGPRAYEHTRRASWCTLWSVLVWQESSWHASRLLEDKQRSAVRGLHITSHWAKLSPAAHSPLADASFPCTPSLSFSYLQGIFKNKSRVISWTAAAGSPFIALVTSGSDGRSSCSTLGSSSHALRKGKAERYMTATLKLQGETNHSGPSCFPECSGQLHRLKYTECFLNINK